MKRKVTLNEAIESMYPHNYSMKYDEENDKFIIPLYKSDNPRIDVEINTDFTVGPNGEYIGDLKFRKFPEYIDGMNMNFNGNAEVVFGNYRTDNKKHVFSITDPKEAEQVLIRVGLNHDFYDGQVAGQSVQSPEAKSALYFEKIDGSDRLEDGLDYYILNVGHVLGQPDRDVSQYLEKMSSTITNEEKTYEYEQERKHKMFETLISNYENNREENNRRIEELKSLVANSSLPKDSGLCKKILEMKPLEKDFGSPYNLLLDNFEINKLYSRTATVKDVLDNLPEYTEKMEQYKEALEKYGVSIKEDPNDDYITGTHFQVDLSCFDMPAQDFSLTKNGIDILKNIVIVTSEYGDQLVQNATAKRQKEQEEQEKMKELDKRGKETGCPSNLMYTFYVSSNLSDGRIADIIVVDENGKTREPDITDMDGFSYDKSKYMCWNQIHENEAVITLEYDADLDRTIQFHPEWMPPALSEAQINTIVSFVEESSERYHMPIETEEGKETTQEEIIKVCEEKYNEQENEIDKAYKYFKDIEEKLEYTLTDEYAKQIAEDPKSAIDLESTAENYFELADLYGFETKLEISGFEEDKMIIYEKSNDTYDR